ncbi:MAG: hypothetical protein K6C36_04895, partial [Clostridia bacterium]|nr:hypothetical protein [Clostridia bacterium]
MAKTIGIKVDTNKTEPLSEYIFGHNLEHTRSAVNGGLSAQMLRNRKFAGKPSIIGVASEWDGVGDLAFFQNDGSDAYTRHIGCEKMPRRNELQSQRAQNVHGGVCGIRQGSLYIKSKTEYEFRAVVKSCEPVRLRAALTSSDGATTLAEAFFDVEPGDWEILRAEFEPEESDDSGCLYLTFFEKTLVTFGAASLMPADNFRGMRRDVVDCLKQIAPTVLRWPGGNFAGEYRWKDGLLPSDMRGPLQSFMEDETQPYSHGYDFHEISTDDFIALCREIGAEPFLTINAVWNTPEESAGWVEYCNGLADTEYGAKRAGNGSAEPYGVRFWSLGNEMGYGHMEGPKGPAEYASLARLHAEAMLDADPQIELFSSGPYPNDDWARDSAAALLPIVKNVSLHHYAFPQMDYTEKRLENTYLSVAGAAAGVAQTAERMRKSLDGLAPGAVISYDEWNIFYSWFRPSCVAEGIFAAKVLNMLVNRSSRLGIAFCTYFQPVNEGAIEVDPGSARLTASGQMFELARIHHGGSLCRLEG